MDNKENNCNKLTHNHKLFCENYLILNNSTKAYLQVYKGAKETTARINACKLLKRQDIQAYIQQIRNKIYTDNLDTIENILLKLKSIYEGETTSKKIVKVKGEPQEIEVEATISEKLKAIELYSKILGFTYIYDEDEYYRKGDIFDGNHRKWYGF